jgi:hypothetical protein
VSNENRPSALLQRTSWAETPRCWSGNRFLHCPCQSDEIASGSLLDLNENSLQAAAAQVKQAKVRTFMRDVMQPSSEPADTGYDSISLFYLLHCLPGTMDDKETAIANLKRYLSKDGVLYGATILGDEAAHNAIGRMLLRLYNDKGVFHNMADTLDDLQRMLRRQFQNVQIRRHNNVALFVARS